MSVDATCSIKLLVHVLVNKNDRFGVHQMEDVQRRMNRQNAKFVNHVNHVHHVTKQQTSAVIRYLWCFNSIYQINKLRRFSAMYQHSKNIARLINFEVYAVRLVPNCKSKLSYVSLIKSREKDITSMSHLVTRIEQKK